MRFDPKQQRKLETERRRGWIVYLLYAARPKPLDFASLMNLLDARNFPLSCRRLSEELDFLRSAGLLRVFPVGADNALDEVAQAKLIERYYDSDGELNDDYCAKITTRGTNFQDDHFNETGVMRVN